MKRMGIGIAISALLLAGSMAARDISGSGTPVSVIVTVRGQQNALTPDDVVVTQNKRRAQVTGFEPVRSQNGLQLWILIDDGDTTALGAQLADLRKFVLAQAPAVEIGIGYMRNGMVQNAQALTTDHEAAAKALRLPLGMAGISSSPYLALEELIKKWPAGNVPREVLMVTSGIDPYYVGPDNPYVNAAIHSAQRAGVIVYSIYYGGAGRWGHNYRLLFWGQNYLGQLSEETGGNLYWLGTVNPVSLAPYLDDLRERLSGQYLLTFVAQPENKPGLQQVKIKAEPPHVKISGPSRVYVQ